MIAALLASATAAAQPANDTCAGAIVVPGGGPFPHTTTPVDITAADDTNAGDPTLCITSSRRLWYSFRPAETAVYRIGSCTPVGPVGGRTDTVIAIYDGTPGCGSSTTLTSVACDDDSLMSTGPHNCSNRSAVHALLNANQLYYVIIASYSTTVPSAADTLAFTVDKVGAPAANDTCAGAVVVPPPAVNGFSSSPLVNSERALEAGDQAASCNTTATRGLWYTFTPTTTAEYRLETCQLNQQFNVNPDTTVSVYTSSNGACTGTMSTFQIGTSNACNSSNCGTHGAVTGTFTAGTTYFVQLSQSDDNVNPPGFSDVQLRIVGPRSNDTCDTAAPLTLSVKTEGFTVGANDHQLDGGSAYMQGSGNTTTSATGRDVVYSFAVPATGAYSFRVSPSSTSTNTVLYIGNTCATGQLLTPGIINAVNKGSAEELTCVSLTQGQTIYAFVDESTYSFSAGSSFDIEVTPCLSEVEPNNLPSEAGALTCGLTGGINPAGEADFFSLGSPPANSRVFAFIDGYSSSLNGVDLRVTTDTSTLEFDTTDNDTQFGSSAPNIAGTPLTGGSAYLRVNYPTATSVSEPYRIYGLVQQSSPNAETEPNDTRAAAWGGIDNYFSGTLPAGPSGGSVDVDYYAFTAFAGETLMLNLDGNPDRDAIVLNGQLDLLSAAGEVLVSVNDTAASAVLTSFATLDAGSPTSPAEGLVFRAPVSGTYYARVSPGTNSTTTGLGDYLLSISRDCKVGDGIVAPATVSGFTPTSGGTMGGQPITVSGSGFVDGARVRIGGNFSPQTTFVNSTTLNAITPAGTAGNANVEVVHPGLQAVAAAGPFLYVEPPTITSVSPDAGTTLGGTPFVISGTQFIGTGLNVTFGGATATITVDSPSQISGTTPPHAAGNVDVTVNGQFGSYTATGAFTYIAPPNITSVSPPAGSTLGGNTVTLNGSGFTAATEIKLDGVVIPQNASGTASQLFFTAPAHAAGAVSIQVTNPDGQTQTVLGAYTYVAPPDITAINPPTGATTGNEVVTITGTNFDSNATVTFDTDPATSVTVTGGTSITATTPGHAAGVVTVTVRNADGQTDTITFEYIAANNPPVISAINPTSGTTNGGTVVTITGTDFADAGTVTFDGIPATSVVITPAQITATTPAHAFGAVDVVVTNPDNQFAQLDAGYLYVAPQPTLAATPISPSSGRTTGTTSITITGDEFLDGATVDLGGQACTNVVRVDKTTLTCTAQPHAAGFVSVTVTNPDGKTVSASNAFEYIPAPTVSGAVTPNSGPTAGGTSVVITGTGFRTGAAVRFGTTASTNVTVNSATQITAITPAVGSAGTVSVTVTNADTQAATLANAFTYHARPAVTGVSPNQGYTAGGTAVIISGAGFRTGATVEFIVGGTAASATGITVSSATAIAATTPAHAAGLADVRVTNVDGQTFTLIAGFRFVPPPTATSVTPTRGPVTGGTRVTVTGTNFLSGATVSLDGAPAVAVAVAANGQSISGTTSAHAAGTVSIVITNPDGQAVTLANSFTYDEGPTLTAVTPDVGPVAGGNTVTLTGTGFQTGATVIFGTSSATVTNVTATSITVTAPARPAGVVRVLVTNPDGQRAELANAYRYVVAPTLTSLAPATGPDTGGTRVTLTGTGLVAGTTVTFGGVAGTDVVVLSATSAQATTPAHAAGAVDVVITTPQGGTATLTGGFTYTATGPTLSLIAPTSGTTEGGTVVTLTGSNFRAGATVKFGGTDATNVVVVSSTLARATTPAHAAGTVDVDLTNSDGLGSRVSSGYTYVTPSSPTEGRVTDGGTGGVSEEGDPDVIRPAPACGCSAGSLNALMLLGLASLFAFRRRKA